VRFDTLKKGDNFNSIDYLMKIFTFPSSPVFNAFAFSENDLAGGWRARGRDGGFVERLG
jgi:hypothetical protein